MHTIDWLDPKSAWMVKLLRARDLIGELNEAATQFKAIEPWRVERRPGRTASEWAYYLRSAEPVPAMLSAIAGDVIHNLRASLDAVAFAMACQRVPESKLTMRQTRAIQFPIEKNEDAFEAFFNHKHRKDLFARRDIDAFEVVQPFAIAKQARALQVEVNTSEDVQFELDELQRLHRLDIVDKHRRLPILTWRPSLTSWQGDPEDYVYEARPGPFDFASHPGELLLGFFRSERGMDRPRVDPWHEISLVLGDDIYRHDLVGTLQRFLDYLRGWVMPRVFAVLQGAAHPPIILLDDNQGYR